MSDFIQTFMLFKFLKDGKMETLYKLQKIQKES